jgi:hypothetical protein
MLVLGQPYLGLAQELTKMADTNRQTNKNANFFIVLDLKV